MMSLPLLLPIIPWLFPEAGQLSLCIYLFTIARAASTQYSRCSWPIVGAQHISYIMLRWALVWRKGSGTALRRWAFRCVEGTGPG